MSFQAMAWAYAQQTGDVHRKAVLICLANHERDGWCYPSIARISQETEIASRRTIQKKIDELVEKGLIVVKEQFTKAGRQTSNRYYLNWAGLPKVEDDQPLEEGEGARDAPSIFEPGSEPQNAAQSGAEPPSSPRLRYERSLREAALREGAPSARGRVHLVTGGGCTGDAPGGASGDTPRTLIGTNKGNLTRADARDPQEVLFDQWWEAYPQHGHGWSKDRARVAWRALSDEDRTLALEQVERITNKHMHRGKPKEPWYWLSDRVFAAMAEERGRKAPASAPSGYFGRPNTPQWEAWAKHMGKPPRDYRDDDGNTHIGLRPMSWHNGADGRWFTSEWPPVADESKSLAGVAQEQHPLL